MPLSAPDLRVAIVGTGPSGFYAAEALQRAVPTVQVDLFDRLPTPYGLVRGGVAPDHPKIKSVTRIFDRIAAHAGTRFIGNVTVGRDVTPTDLRANYDVVIYAVGAEADRALGIPGESLPGSHAATEFVGWYNGHPDYRDATFDLGVDAAVVVGLGNVAMDVTRILARLPDELRPTDIAEHAVQHLATSSLRTIHVLGRRGPVQAAFSTTELRELGELAGVDVIVDPRDLALDLVSAAELASTSNRDAAKSLEVLRDWAARPRTGAARQIVLHFGVSPVEVLGLDRVTGLRVVRNHLVADGHGSVRAVAGDDTFTIPAGLIFRSVGYRGIEIPGVPFDPGRGRIPNAEGRVVEHVDSHTAVDGLYVCGWIKRGPSGVIGTNKVDATQTVDHILADVVAGRVTRAAGSPDRLLADLAARNVRVITWTDWQRIDRAEIAAGQSGGKPREKFARIGEMLDAADPSP